jgi:mevalonate kinase
MYIVSAPAKCILFGEHSVVYGKNAIASSVDLRTYCHCEQSEDLELNLTDLGISFNSRQLSPETPNKAVQAFLKLASLLQVTNLRLTFKTEVPIGAGLGSSASYSVCIAAALLLHSKKINSISEREIINEFAFEAEKVLHGNPSGLDNTIVTYGGFMCYNKQSRTALSANHLRFLVVNTNVPKDTSKQVSMFRDRLEKVRVLLATSFAY